MGAWDTPFPMQGGGASFGEDPVYRLIDDLFSEGIVAPTDLAVVQNPGGADLSVTVNTGSAVIAVDTPYGGKRRCRLTAASNSGTPGIVNAADWITTFATPHATLPRIDRVVAIVRDSNVDSSGAYDVKLKVIAGTATSGATLTNLTGAAAVPVNSFLLANVLVGAAATQILSANIDTTIRIRAANGLGATVGGAGGKLAYNKFTTGFTVNVSTEATALTIVTADSIAFDGATDAEIAFFAPSVTPAQNDLVRFALYDSFNGGAAASIGIFANGSSTTSTGNAEDHSVFLSRLLEGADRPAAGTHVYSVRAWRNAVNGAVSGGAGGSGNLVPGYIRVTRA
jgi:hypothetical protein